MPKAGTVPMPRLREVREGQLMTQGELAEKTGLAKSTIIDLERGRSRAHFRTVRKIAEALGVATSDLTAPVEPLPPVPAHSDQVSAGPMTDNTYRPAGRPRYDG